MYSANLSKCSLKPSQCRIIARLLLENPTENDWKIQIVDENILQMRASGASLTIAAHLRHRLESVSRDIWILVRDGESQLSTQASFSAALKHSVLLRDFVDLQVREEIRLFHPALSKRSWDEFFIGCAARHSGVEKWSEPVVTKLRQNVFRILAEAGQIVDTQTKTLQRLSLYPELVQALEDSSEQEILRALSVYAI